MQAQAQPRIFGRSGRWEARAESIVSDTGTQVGGTFVLVHGAWRGGWCWRRVADLLGARGHKVFAPTLTGLAERSHLFQAGTDIGLGTHVADVAGLFHWEGLSDVVLCGHSYGGMVVSAVAERLAASPAAIRALVLLDAFVPADGEALLDLASPTVRDAIRPGSAWRRSVPPRPPRRSGRTSATGLVTRCARRSR